MARAAPSTRARARVARRGATTDVCARAEGRRARARAAIAAYDCVEFVDDSERAVGEVRRRGDARRRARGRRARAAAERERASRVGRVGRGGADAVVRTSALRRIESDFSQRKEDRRLDPHGERAVDAWALAEG